MAEASSPKHSFPNAKHMLWAIIGAAVVLLSALVAIWLYNQTVLQKPLQRVLLSDVRNRVVSASAKFDGWVNPHTVVFDLTDISDDASSVDILRVFLQYAKAEKDRSFDQIVLAAFGQKKFVLPGVYFRQLGAEYDSQNPVYTMRTFAQHVSTMDGSKPFPVVEGGIFYVLPAELNQFKTLNERWYLNDYILRHK